MLDSLKSSRLKQCVVLVTFLIDRQKLHLTGKALKKYGQGKKFLFFFFFFNSLMRIFRYPAYVHILI